MIWFRVQATKELREDDIAGVDFDNLVGAMIYISQNIFSGDGYRIISYDDHGPIDEIRPGSSVMVRYYKQSVDNQVEYETLEDANDAIAALDPSDGYFMYDLEEPGFGRPSIAMNSRPSMWLRHYVDGNSSPGTLVDSRVNEHKRSDEDRI